MIYWLEKLKWRVRKFLGLTRGKRVRTIDDLEVSKLIGLIVLAILVVVFCDAFVRLVVAVWSVLFPRRIPGEVTYL